MTTVITSMKQRYRAFRRGWGTWYCEDTQTGKQETLHTKDRHQARTIVQAKNEALRQPTLNLQLARAYLNAADPAFLSRIWQWVMTQAGEGKQGATGERWKRAMAQKPFDRIHQLKLVETKAEDLLNVLNTDTPSTNLFLRKLHNFALDMNWLVASIIPRRQWRPIRFAERRALT
jgi:hypothetical protein